MSALDNYSNKPQAAMHSLSIHDAASKAFDEIFKKPPSRLGEGDGSLKNAMKKVVDNANTMRSKSPGESSEEDVNAGKARIETTWYDSYVERRNISMDDRKAADAIMNKLRIPEKSESS